MSLAPIASIGTVPTSPTKGPAATAATGAASFLVVSKDVTSIMPPGYTQTQTTKADGIVTTVITNATGGTVDTLYGTSTMQTPELGVNVWA